MSEYNNGSFQENDSSWFDDDARLAQALRDQGLYYEGIEEGFVGITDKTGRVRKWQEFYATEIPTPPMLIGPFLPRGGLALLHGKRGLGKTMLGLAIARSVDSGESLFGKFPVTKGKVLYLQLDMTEKVFHERLRATKGYLNLENAMIFVGTMNIMRVKKDDERIEKIREFGPDLIILDTLRKSHSLDENDSNTPSKYLEKLRELFGWGPAMLLIHHDRKTYENNSTMTEEAFRGSGAWLDDVDAGLQLKKVGRDMVLSFTKVRTCGHIDDMSVVVDDSRMVIDMANAVLWNEPDVEKIPVGITKRQRFRLLLEAFRASNPEADRTACAKWLLTMGAHKSEASRLSTEFFNNDQENTYIL